MVDRHIICAIMEQMESTLAMTAFVRAVEREGFSPAARELGVTPSAVSKLVTRLERKLGVVLLHRTTRRLALTPEGELFFERAQAIVEAIADAEHEVMRFGERPRGKLRMNVGTAFGTYVLVPALPEFRARYPEIELELSLTTAWSTWSTRAPTSASASARSPMPTSSRASWATLTRVICARPSYLARARHAAHARGPRGARLPDASRVSRASASGRSRRARRAQVTVRGTVTVEQRGDALRARRCSGSASSGSRTSSSGRRSATAGSCRCSPTTHRPEALPLYAVYPADAPPAAQDRRDDRLPARASARTRRGASRRDARAARRKREAAAGTVEREAAGAVHARARA